MITVCVNFVFVSVCAATHEIVVFRGYGFSRQVFVRLLMDSKGGVGSTGVVLVPFAKTGVSMILLNESDGLLNKL